MKTAQFYAGAAQEDITPPLGTLINGNFIAYYARSVHDALYSKALVLRREKILLAIVVVDICLMRKDFIDEVKALIRAETGILPDRILISSTHTHAAGSIESLLLAASDLPYRKKLKGLIVQSVLKAVRNLQPAKTAFGRTNVPEHVVCRRYMMQPGYRAFNPVTGRSDRVKTNPLGDEDKIERRRGVPDTGVGYLAVQGLAGHWISLLANYSMHYVGDWENGTLTADYFGFFARQVQADLGTTGEFVVMMTNGTSGDANIADFLQPDRYPKLVFEKSALIGRDIAKKVVASVGRLEWETDPVINATLAMPEIRVRKPSAGELREARHIVAGARYENLSVKDSHTGNDDVFRQIYAREQVLLQEYPDTVLFPVQAMRIGSGVIGALGGEFFSETGLWLKKNCGIEHYFTICLANGYAGYVPPEREFELGGYETWRCRSSFLEENAEAVIRKKLLGLLGQD